MREADGKGHGLMQPWERDTEYCNTRLAVFELCALRIKNVFHSSLGKKILLLNYSHLGNDNYGPHLGNGQDAH